MKHRKNLSSGAVWEDQVGYSRAVKIGNRIEVSGTVAVDENGTLIGKGDHYVQAQFIIQKIEKALKALGGSLKDVIRTRMFVTDISKWEEVGRAHGEAFGKIKPATSMLEVSALIGEDHLLEIEATAIVAV